MRKIALAAASLASAAWAGPADLRSVAAMQYHARVLLVFAPSLRDARLAEERRTMAAMALEASARDLVLVQVADQAVIGAHDKAEHLRRRFRVPQPEFRALLIGKDGHVAREQAQPFAARDLIGAIDAMPMRQDEVRRTQAGRRQPG